jgi:GT2 family glycosyltransferase/2-polyprenyl-3-methyl-5-hydroxy-6-metoxy-1,4-benzoquinol methylase
VRSEDLVVIIPTCGRPDILSLTLNALMAQIGAGEVVVMLDGADAEAPRVAGARYERLKQGGPGSARNRGVAISSRPLILFLGDDMVPDRGFVDAHLTRHTQEPDHHVAVQGNMTWHARCRKRPANRWLDISSMQFDLASIGPGEDAGWGRFYSSNVSIKRALFETTGGFDPDFVYYYEDLDLAWRLHVEGMQLRFEPKAMARHAHPYDLDQLKRRFVGVAVGEIQMREKHKWFEPWFHTRFRQYRTEPPARPIWAHLAELPIPARWRARVDERAQHWYRQQIAEAFLDSWDSELDLRELREYLGTEYDESKLWRHAREVELEESLAPDEQAFYRTSTAYLYDLTAFATWPTKLPYRLLVRNLTPRGGWILDYGCGIGSDGLRLAEDGYSVAFADFDNPSTRYLKWRLARRKLDLPVHVIDSEIPGPFEVAYAFDVLEHADDPFEVLSRLESLARVVVVNLLDPAPGDSPLHRAIPVNQIVDRAERKGLLHHHRHHGRSLLLAYRGDID